MDSEKAYKEALERARKFYNDCVDGDNPIQAQRYVDIFPELKESDDERIRKAIGAAICGTTAISILEANGTNLPDALSFLEKQKEQDVKVISWREPDDCADIPEGHYVVIAYKPGVFGLGYIGNGKVVCAPGQKPSGILYIPNSDESIIVESKEQQPAEWSKQDEMRLKEALEVLNESIKYLPMGCGYTKDVMLVTDWLKSLRPQPHWKPSEEQIEALKLIVGNKKHYAPVLHEIALDTLYNDLKKL